MRTDSICAKGEKPMIRVSKPTAKKAYQNGKKVRCAMIYDRVSGFSDTFEVVGDFETFEREALFYNACKERGSYLKFYTELGGKRS